MTLYYGGFIKSQEPISIKNLDLILDLIDEYIELAESCEVTE